MWSDHIPILDPSALSRVRLDALLHGRYRIASPAADETYVAESTAYGKQRGRQDASECEGLQRLMCWKPWTCDAFCLRYRRGRIIHNAGLIFAIRRLFHQPKIAPKSLHRLTPTGLSFPATGGLPEGCLYALAYSAQAHDRGDAITAIV